MQKIQSRQAHFSILAMSEQQPQPRALKGGFTWQKRAVQIKLCRQDGVGETGHDSLHLDEV